jgi:hypothetical protein
MARSSARLDCICCHSGYLSWNRPDSSWPNLRPCSTTFTFTRYTSCTYVYLIYIYLLVYSVGQTTQSSYAVVDALSTANMFSHTRLDHKRNSIRLIRVLPKLSDTLLIRCEVVHVVLPPASKYDIDYKEDGGEEAYEPAILPLATENDAECPSYVCLSYT